MKKIFLSMLCTIPGTLFPMKNMVTYLGNNKTSAAAAALGLILLNPTTRESATAFATNISNSFLDNFWRWQENEQLLEAATNNNLQGIKNALAHGASINAQNYSGQTALMLATKPEIIHYLLLYSPNIELADRKGVTALIKASQSANKPMMKLLLDAGAQTAFITDFRYTHSRGAEFIRNYLAARAKQIQSALTSRAIEMAVENSTPDEIDQNMEQINKERTQRLMIRNLISDYEGMNNREQLTLR